MAINFPSSPSNGEEYTDPNSGTWVYDSGTNSWTLTAGGSTSAFNFRGGHDFRSSTPPAAPIESGDMWIHDAPDGTIDGVYTGISGQIGNGQLVLWDGNSYVMVSGTVPGYPDVGDGEGGTLDSRYLKLGANAGAQTVATTETTTFNGLVEGSIGIKVTGKTPEANIKRGNDAIGLQLRPSALSSPNGQVIGTQIQTADSITIDGNNQYVNCMSDTRTNVACSQSVGFQSSIAYTENATDAVGFQAVVKSTSVGENFYGFHTEYSADKNAITGKKYAFYAEGTASSRFNGVIYSTRGIIGNIGAENVERPGGIYNKYGFGLQVSNAGSVCSFARNGGNGPAIEIKQTEVDDYHIAFNTESNGAVKEVGNIKNNSNEDGLIFYAGGTASREAAYTVVSDRRVKSNIVDAPSAVELIKDLQPRQYDLAISKNVRGFVADELQQVVPEAVVGTANAEQAIGTLADYDGTVLETEITEPDDLTYTEDVTDSEGVTTQVVRTRTWTATGTRPVYQSVDQTMLIPLLTKALQEALERIEALEAAATSSGY